MTDNSFTILSVNSQGLGDVSKRKDVFHYFRDYNANIYCIQDTHFTPEKENAIRAQWGYDCYFSSYTSNSRGIAILMNNNFEYTLRKEIKDENGNYLALDITIDEKNITIISVYGPNTDKPEFFENIANIIDNLDNEKIILCGDFNLVLDPVLDYDNYKNINNKKARQKLLDIIEEKHLLDPFRELHPDCRRYTWRKRTPRQQARLDFFLISQNMLSSIQKVMINSSYRSDHSPILMKIKFNEFKPGKGLWKFNNSLLHDIEYSNLIRQKILEVKKQYVPMIYNIDRLSEIPDSEIQFTINDQLFLETLLMELRGKTISYASFKKKSRSNEEKILRSNINKLEENMTGNYEKLEILKTKLEKLRQEKMKGHIIRCKTKWIEEGEKPTSYFLNLESRNFTNKIITKLEIDDGNTVTDQNMILKEVENFYANLYKEDTSLKDINLNELINDDTTLSMSGSNKLEGLLTYEEAAVALKNMKNEKSPGSDGFTSEFIKFFWKDLGHFIVRSINYGYTRGELSVTQKHGIITCVPKSNKSRLLLKNWRPITLLNVIYKIASSAIANRLKKVLDLLISSDQAGFVPGRYMGDCTRTIYDVMKYTEENYKPGLLLLIDFEKAFDTISWKFINKVLDFYKFGPSIKKRFKFLFTNNITASVIKGAICHLL